MALGDKRSRAIYGRAWGYIRRLFPSLTAGNIDRLARLAVMYVEDPDQFK